MKSLRSSYSGLAVPPPGGYLPPLSLGLALPGVALVLAFAIFVASGQIEPGDPLGLAALVGVAVAATLVVLLLLAAGKSAGGLGRAWAIVHPLAMVALLLVAAADTGERGAAGGPALLAGVVLAAAAQSFGTRYVALLGVLAVAGIVGAEAAGDAAGYPTDYDLAVASAVVVAACGAAFAAWARSARPRAIGGERLQTARTSASRLEAVARYSPAALAIFGRDGRPVSASPAIERLLGSPLPWPPGAPGDTDSEPARAVADAIGGRPRRLEFTATDPAGRLRVIDGVFFPVDRGAALLAIDVTNVRELTDRVSQVQRMETLGVIASGLAHDFNNLLTVVLGNLHLARVSLANSAEAEAVIEETTRACERAAEIIRRLMDYARAPGTALEEVSIRSVVEETAALARGLLPPSVDLEVRPPSAAAMVSGTASGLEQVLLNLVMNARDALPGGGRIHIWTEEIAVREGLPPPDPALAAGRYVVIAVSDTGVGMDSATLARVFDPFFTTKEAGKGTGLGLATAQGIVQAYGGTIVAESLPGRGSTFRVYVPALAAPAAAAAAS